MLRALAAQRHVVPAILISARDDAPTRALIRSWPGIPFLRKPFGDDELLAAIAQSLKSGGAGQQDIPRKP